MRLFAQQLARKGRKIPVAHERARGASEKRAKALDAEDRVEEVGACGAAAAWSPITCPTGVELEAPQRLGFLDESRRDRWSS